MSFPVEFIRSVAVFFFASLVYNVVSTERTGASFPFKGNVFTFYFVNNLTLF